MKTILYKEIFTTKNLSWKYYVNQLDFKLFGENEDCIDNENSMFFLKNFIIESGKSKTKLFDDISDLEKKPERVNHIMSTYFLGIYFYENHPLINESIKKEVLELQKFMDKQNKGKECKHNSSFLFIWFLICLFHDLGYKYENDTSVYKDLDVFRSDNEIDVDLITKDKGVPKVIQYNYKKYFEYRLKYHGKNDHGICAGLLLYSVSKKTRYFS